MSHYLIYAIMMGCTSTQSTTSTSQGEKYSEDLSHVRPVFPQPEIPVLVEEKTPTKKDYVEARFAVTPTLNTLLDSIDRINLMRKSVDGFTIQVYSGQKKEDALNAKRTIDQALPELNAEMVYLQPTFRIKAGKYYTQLEAQKDFVAVKRLFPDAILVPDKISTITE